MNTTKKTVIGIVAHVDAGKTTLAEAMLYISGGIRKLGRVDHRDCFLDTHELERAKGITIFSKQARLQCGDTAVTLLDTPGHADFSAEAERSLQVLDYAVLVISGTDGVQAHTETLWRMLKVFAVPCFIFVSKTDLPGKTRAELMQELKQRLGVVCVDFSDEADIDERIAECDEQALESFFESGSVRDELRAQMIRERKLLPCFFGSGLKLEGVDALLAALDRYTLPIENKGAFGARVFKITRDAQGARITHLKITSGSLSVRTPVSYTGESGESLGEKITQIRLYSGTKYETAEKVSTGEIAAVLGLSGTYPGQGLGIMSDNTAAQSEPVLSYTLILPAGTDAKLFYPKLLRLQEEDPQLRISWNGLKKTISIQLMGAIQKEIIKKLIEERFDVSVEFDAGHIMYRETIANTVEGVGHFEPLRHYAEVHLILEPLAQGSGLVFETTCSEDELDRNWQRLILTHLAEKKHIGVLTGSPITDMKITLAAGKAHIKHTEGGDFRQATYRAVRQGLMQAESVLLEPWYAFTVTLPPEMLGRAMSDIKSMGGEFGSPDQSGALVKFTGAAPVAEMNGYYEEVIAYSKGRGTLSVRPNGYRPCRNAQSVIDEFSYSPEADIDNTPDSVFCAHGGGINIRWNEVKENMHLESVLKEREKKTRESTEAVHRTFSIDERELEAIMEREFGPIKRPEYGCSEERDAEYRQAETQQKQKYIIVDGYNLIFSWPELKHIAEDDMDLARERLMDILSNYAGYTKTETVLVFDGYRNLGSTGSKDGRVNINVVFTADGETADNYIERIANDIGKNYSVRVVTSDNLIRLSALRSGILRVSSKEFQAEAEDTMKSIAELLKRTNDRAHLTRIIDGKQ